MQLENGCAVDSTERRDLKIQRDGTVSADHSTEAEVLCVQLHCHHLTCRAKYSSAISTSYFTEMHLLEVSSMRGAACSAFMPCLIRWSYKCQNPDPSHLNNALELTSLEKTGPSSHRTNPTCSQHGGDRCSRCHHLHTPHGAEAVPWSTRHRTGSAGGKTSAGCAGGHSHSSQGCSWPNGACSFWREAKSPGSATGSGSSTEGHRLPTQRNSWKNQFPSLQLLKYFLRDSTLLQMCQIRWTHSALSFCHIKQ